MAQQALAAILLPVSRKQGMTRMQDALATLDGQKINVATLAEAVAGCMERLRAGRGFSLFTLNLDHMVKRRADPAFRDAYARADLVTADGAPVVRLARRQGARLERTTGADLVDPLCAAAAREGAPVYFFGSSDATLARAADELRRRHPGLIVAGHEAPPMGFDPRSPAAERAGAAIAASGARLCFVALGAPKQEILADRLSRRHPGVGFVCIGAALDFISGEQNRAPRVFQTSGLEWLWRLAGDPRRLAGRYARCAALLADLALLEPLRRRMSHG